MERIFSRVESSRGYLKEKPADGRAKLPDKGNSSIVMERKHANTAGMAYDLKHMPSFRAYLDFELFKANHESFEKHLSISGFQEPLHPFQRTAGSDCP